MNSRNSSRGDFGGARNSPRDDYGMSVKSNSSGRSSEQSMTEKRNNMLNQLATAQSRANGNTSAVTRDPRASPRYSSESMNGGNVPGNPTQEYRSQKSPPFNANGFSSSQYASDELYGSHASFNMDAVKKKESKKEENKKGRGFFSILSRDSKSKESKGKNPIVRKKSSSQSNGEDSDTFNSSNLSDNVFNDDKFDNYFSVGH
jgi:hypothetical protein